MANHTPAPWRNMGEDEPTKGVPALEIGSGTCGTPDFVSVAYVNSDLVGREFKITPQTKANAHLIAAAPELYDALKAAVAHIHDLRIVLDECREMGMTIHMCGVTYDDVKACAAIAKAEGVQR